MVSPRISVMVPSNAAISVAIYQRVLPSLSQAVSAVAQQLVIDWTEGVQRAKLWSVEKDAYASSIKWEMTGPFSAVVVSSYRYAQEIETGRPARDLKRMLDTSFKVRVNAIRPGFFPAEQNRALLTPERTAQIMAHNPIKRFGEAHELVGAVLYLASEEASSFVTGSILTVDGGFTAMTI